MSVVAKVLALAATVMMSMAFTTCSSGDGKKHTISISWKGTPTKIK